MKTKSLEVLEKAELPTAQARAILEAMETEMSDSLATKSDLQNLKAEFHSLELSFQNLELRLDAKLKGLETRLVFWMFGMFLALAGLLRAFPGR